MEEKVLTLADIGVTTLHIGYSDDRSKAVIEINRVDKDGETLSKLKTLKDNFKFRPTGQMSLYEIESIETYEHFYRLFCTRVEDDDAPKVSTERNDDGSVTFSVPTVQGFRIKEGAVPVFVPHGDEPGERGELGDMNNEAIRFFSDVIGPFTSDSWQSPHSAIVKSLKTEKAIKFVDSWFAKKPPRKSLFILKEGSNDIFILTNVSIAAEEYGVITFEFSYYGNIMGPDVSIPTAVGKRGSLPFQNGMLTYTDVAADGSKDGNVFMFCRGGRGNGKPIFDPSNPEHRSIIMQGLREMMMLIEDKYPQLHRARLNKPKSI